MSRFQILLFFSASTKVHTQINSGSNNMNHSLKITATLLIYAVIIQWAAVAFSGEMGVNIYGASWHYTERTFIDDNGNTKELKEFNPGFGVRYVMGENEKRVWFLECGGYEDSEYNTSIYAAVGYQRKLFREWLRAGAGIAFFDTDTYDCPVIPLPVISLRFKSAEFHLAWWPYISGINDNGTLSAYMTIYLKKF